MKVILKFKYIRVSQLMGSQSHFQHDHIYMFQ